MTNMENNNKENIEKTDNKLMVPASIVVAGLLIAGAIMYVSGPRNVPSPAAQQGNAQAPTADPTQALKIKSSDFVQGNPGAKVTIVEYADFQCPFCGRFYTDSEQKIIDNYVKTGKAVFVWRDFAFLGEESTKSAEAARCAGEQGKFWDFHDYLYTHQNGENQGGFADAKLKGFAGILKLDTAAFSKCLDLGKYKQAVDDATAEGRSIGVNGTPATFVNGVLVSGAQPYTVFQGKIEEALKK